MVAPRNLFAVLTLLLVLASIGASAMAQSSEHPGPVKRTVSGNELRVGDPYAPDSPVTVIRSRDNSDDTSGTLGPTAEDAENELSVTGQQTLEAGNIRYKRARALLLAIVPLNGWLAVDSADLYGPYWLEPGVVTTLVDWTPRSQTYIGLTEHSSGTVFGCWADSGSWECIQQVNQAGWYSPTVWNWGPQAIDYTGSTSW